MAPEIDLSKARKAENVHEKLVAEQVSKIEAQGEPAKKKAEMVA
jgi:hypothetical protein